MENVKFPNKGQISLSYPVVKQEDGSDICLDTIADGNCPVTVKNTIPGQRVRFFVKKKRGGKAEGQLLDVITPSELECEADVCPNFGTCGGCNYQSISYEEQLRIKSTQVVDLLEKVVPNVKDVFEGILPSPRQFGYRNKMEFTFGDAYKDGPLVLGMHKRGSLYDIVSVRECAIIDADYRKILSCTEDFFREEGLPFYHRIRHEGYLRHLLVRKAVKTEQILIDLVTTTQLTTGAQTQLQQTACPSGKQQAGAECVAVNEQELLHKWVQKLLCLELDGEIVGILHTKNDSKADAVKNEGTELLFGQDYFYEDLLGLTFRITPFSFFQTNSLGAEVLYDTARRFIYDAFTDSADSLTGKTVFDLYSGTGTIAQMLAPVAGDVVGIEIIAEAVEAAKENAEKNGLSNCTFLAGDVLKLLDDLEEKPDFIVLDPPRDGIHPKALQKIIKFGVEKMIYISCKPTSLQRDLVALQESGYQVERVCCVDMFPGTVHVETVCLLGNPKS